MKYLILSLVSLFLSGASMAQETPKKVHFGFSFTPQLGTTAFSSELVADNKSGIDYLLGGDIMIDLSPTTQFVTGLTLHRVKLKYRDYSPQFPGDVLNGMALIYNSYWDFNYSDLFIGLPVEFKVKLSGRDKSNHVFLAGGIRIQRLLLNAGFVQLNESGQLWEKRDPDGYYFDFQKMWFLPNVGLGYEFKFGKGKFSIQPDYEYSLSKILKKKPAVDASGRSSFLGIKLSYY